MTEDLRDKPDSYWQDRLNQVQYDILRKKGTEPAFTGELLNNKKTGMYVCGACGHPLFNSETKYESGSGWPSFWQAVDEKAVELRDDDSHGMHHRTEVVCANCGSHLGHLFDDGPNPTGQRYCVNSASLKFEEALVVIAPGGAGTACRGCA